MLASAGPAVLADGIELNLDPVAYGEGHVVTVEVRDNPGIGSRPLYYGISEPFALTVGLTKTAEVRVPITAVPAIVDDDLGGPAVTVSGVVGDGYVGSTQVELVLRSRHGVPRRLLDDGFEFTYPDLGPALEGILRETNTRAPQ